MLLHGLLHVMTRCGWRYERVGVTSSADVDLAVQALAVAEKTVFSNCLVAMRPGTTWRDLPSRHDIEVHIHNEFVDCLKKLKSEILVSYPCRSSLFGLTFRHRMHLVGSL
jgi:hypothetical protein